MVITKPFISIALKDFFSAIMLKRTSTSCFAILLLFLLLKMPAVHAQDYSLKFNHLTVEEGLSHTDANDIKQDQLGFIWIATYFGLDRYDGYTIKRFYNYNFPKHNAFKNRVISISPDKDGNIWLATEDGIQCFNSRTEKYIDFKSLTQSGSNDAYSKIIRLDDGTIATIRHNQLNISIIKNNILQPLPISLPANFFVYDMACDKSGNLWLTSNNGVWKLNNHRKILQVNALAIDSTLDKISIDQNGNLLISNNKKLYLINSSTAIIINAFDLPNGFKVTDVIQDMNDNYWVSTGSGLILLNSRLQHVVTITSNSFTNSINTNALNRLFIDKSQCLWVGTFGGGVNYCDLNAKAFHTLQHNPEVTNTLSGNHIRAVLEDNDKLWIGTNANGLNCYDLKTKKFSSFNSFSSTVKLKSDNIQSLALDDVQNLWIGTDKGVDILDVTRKKLWKPGGYNHFPVRTVEGLTKDCFGNIWFGNHSEGIACIWHDKKGNYNVKYYDGGYFIWADKKNPVLLVSSIAGLKRLIIDSTGNVITSYHYLADSGANSLSSNYTYPICSQNDNTFWIGTIGGGLDRLVINKDDTYKINSYEKSYGIFEDVECMEMDNNGNIWLGGNGLLCFNPISKKLTRYDKNDGLQGNSFKVGSSFKGRDGRLYFGGINGLNYFYPDSIKDNILPALPVLTDLFINNKQIANDASRASASPSKVIIGYSKTLTLNYLQNNFVISFSSMHFANPSKCTYRYKLLGFDKNWNYTDGKNPTAAYNNLDYKEYNFIVEATNNDGVWSSRQASITIAITPPFWKTGLAKLMYVLLFISGLIGIYIYQARWYRLKRIIAVRDVEENKREEMHQHREDLYQQQLQLFTNVSHELRTPLTLILGPLENMIRQDKNNPINHSYQLMYKNVQRLMNLINELMNFRKVAESVIPLHVQPIELSNFLQQIFEEFYELAEAKTVAFSLIDNTGNILFWLDRQILEKILFNLLNNSFKYTEPGGKVEIEAFLDFEKHPPPYENNYQILNNYRAQKYIYFRVADTGIGISKDSINKIFDRYYRINTNHLGSGVGLALVKSLAVLHKGDIYVFSERFKGTEIIIGLPINENDYLSSEKANGHLDLSTPKLEKLNQHIVETTDEPAIGQLQAPAGKQHILIVEDNNELRRFLRDSLKEKYYIHEAANGKAGLEIAIAKLPDLIISDVMMPVMDGVELCRQLKQKFETSHIPIIILSAKDALESKIIGMESGADYYFAKPVSSHLLLLTVENLFDQREKLKQKYLNDYHSNASELVHSEQDKKFMEELSGLIEANINKQELDVDFLCQHLFTSRTKLYQKIKSISGQSVGEFIRTARLKKGIYIMTHENITLTELIERIGFQSISYYSKAFKKEYGKSPSQFLQGLNKQNDTNQMSDKVNN